MQHKNSDIETMEVREGEVEGTLLYTSSIYNRSRIVKRIYLSYPLCSTLISYLIITCATTFFITEAETVKRICLS